MNDSCLSKRAKKRATDKCLIGYIRYTSSGYTTTNSPPLLPPPPKKQKKRAKISNQLKFFAFASAFFSPEFRAASIDSRKQQQQQQQPLLSQQQWRPGLQTAHVTASRDELAIKIFGILDLVRRTNPVQNFYHAGLDHVTRHY